MSLIWSTIVRRPAKYFQRKALLYPSSEMFYFTRLVTSASMKKIKAKQAAFQRDDGVPVYLKGGTSDKVLLNISVILLLIGLFNSVRAIYHFTKGPESTEQ
ncbi:cytochrome c oxidase subunit 7A1, mitochondrial-like [Orussus abietinus]|uniref:cytochrome c oxidase subunit 7A1, mitochondrial-like n=1 Tax=Orussus abietinus TaxID=222816 RepID=UPI000626C0E4|nr:cytochrome c oxidase subunit 7A1, mitochondrial-like [Orussus abietinus]